MERRDNRIYFDREDRFRMTTELPESIAVGEVSAILERLLISRERSLVKVDRLAESPRFQDKGEGRAEADRAHRLGMRAKELAEKASDVLTEQIAESAQAIIIEES